MLLTGIGRRRTGIGRDHLVVDIDRALHEPVVGLRVFLRARGILQVVGITVVDDNLLTVVNEVARGLNLLQVGRSAAILIHLIRTGIVVVVGQRHHRVILRRT